MFLAVAAAILALGGWLLWRSSEPQVSPVKPITWIPERLTACERDADCMEVTYTCCCDTERGAISAATRQEYYRLANHRRLCQDCAGEPCPRTRPAPAQVRCVERRCRLSS
ncbi:MAG: hypothetical protein HY553_20835 [Elusimicrobia bacterium]|nr:hypothetical protein [Elusimicrobiota bacterium]